ncbi:MAG: glycine cleavage system regulatory protein, partial [Halothiobacillaceae bacterium]
MKSWYMLSIVGKDQPGIVAQVSGELLRAGANLGEASMTRLGGSFAIMLMVEYDGAMAPLNDLLAPVMQRLNLHLHIDAIEAGLHHPLEPDVCITVFGADRTGIVAQVT